MCKKFNEKVNDFIRQNSFKQLLKLMFIFLGFTIFFTVFFIFNPMIFVAIPLALLISIVFAFEWILYIKWNQDCYKKEYKKLSDKIYHLFWSGRPILVTPNFDKLDCNSFLAYELLSSLYENNIISFYARLERASDDYDDKIIVSVQLDCFNLVELEYDFIGFEEDFKI